MNPHNRNIMEYKDPGKYIPSTFLLHSWGSLFGVPSKVPSKPFQSPYHDVEACEAEKLGELS